jgi:anaerobic selenocysteine-containing dehydrogenase
MTMSAIQLEGGLSRHSRKCPICEAGCGVLVTVDAAQRKVIDIRGDENDPLSRGFVCPKSQGMKGAARRQGRVDQAAASSRQ